MSLAEVPDALFASGGAGAGQAIDPVDNQLVAPCPGQIVQLHRCKHALTLRRSDGVEILMHLGIDSVALNGEGFRPLVQVGDRVESGTPLLEFDADQVAARARSLVSVFLIMDNPRVTGLRAQAGRIRQGDDWMRFLLADSVDSPPQGNWLQLPNPGGLHARPAARLVQLVRELPGQVEVESRRARASARSIVALLSLDLGCGDSIRLVSTGLTPTQLAELESHILAGLGDDLKGAAPTRAPAPIPTETGEKLSGVIASRGLALGPVHQWLRPHFDVPVRAGNLGKEERSWQKALRQGATGIEELFARAPLQQQGIFAAHREILQDPSLLEKCRQGLTEGYSAAWSWQQAYQSQADKLAGLANPVLAARANDVRDVGERVLRVLLDHPATPAPPEGSILIAEDLYPSEIVQLDSAKIRGICLAGGGAGSHLSVLARSLDVPSLCGLGPACLQLATGAQVVLEADLGLLWLQPSPEQLRRAEQQLQERARQRLAVREPAVTRDQHRIYVGVHQQLKVPDEVDFLIHSVEAGPRDYLALARAVGAGRRLILKLPGCAPLPELRACSALCRLSVLLGMVTSRASWRTARSQLESWIGESAEIGLLVDVPAAALLAEQLAPEADFLVLDVPALVTHTLALERARPELVALADPLHPALLRLMQNVAQASARHGKPLILHQAAADREALPLWLGLSVDHLSVEPAALPATKSGIRTWSRSHCQELMAQALKLAEPEEVRQLVRSQNP
jgi:phosphotransferase system HPr (HPr) family protein